MFTESQRRSLIHIESEDVAQMQDPENRQIKRLKFVPCDAVDCSPATKVKPVVR